MLLVRRVLLGLALLGAFTFLGFPIGGRHVFGGLLMFGGMGLLAVHLLGRRNRRAHHGTVLLLIAGLAWGLTIPFSPNPGGFLGEHILSLILLCVSLLAAFGLYLELKSLGRTRLTRLALWSAFAVILLATIEVYTPLRQVSDGVRNVLYAGNFIYDSDARDLSFAGGIRPKVFTQEPSHPARFVSVMLVAYVLTSRSRRRWVAAIGLWLVGAYIMRSPSLLLAPAILGALFGHRQFASARPARQMVAALLMIATLAAAPTIGRHVPNERINAIATGEDVSALKRLFGPAKIAVGSMRAHPFGGAGIGGRELVQDIVLDAYDSYPQIWLAEIRDDTGYTGWGNAFFEMFTYSGLALGALLLPLLFIVLGKAYGVGAPAAFFLVIAMFNFDSGFVAGRVWAYFAVIAAVVADSNRLHSPHGLRHPERLCPGLDHPKQPELA